jgi:lysine 2,3-aminomutase
MPAWREIQLQNFTCWKKLAEFLQIDTASILKNPRFPLNLPRRLAEKIQKKCLDDPILRQFLPSIQETDTMAGYMADPVGDKLARKAGKLLHKYQGRALLLVSSSCAMHCRFCFRQNFSYEREVKGFEKELALIKEESSLTEIILSGGDPLSLSNAQLTGLIEELSSIPHIKRLRFHTRFPIGIPERIDEEFLKTLKSTRLQVYFLVHVNHPKELDADIVEALKNIGRLGIPLMTQTVLLRGVNDSVATLKELFETLVDSGITPYSLNLLDRVRGAHHFEVTEEEGKRLLAEVAKTVSGYAMPRFVKEEAGKPSKTWL